MEKNRTWREVTFPGILEEAKTLKASIYFEDETSVRTNTTAGKTWGRKGETPIIHRSGQRVGQTIAGAISNTGRFFYRKYEGGLNGEKYIEFIKGLLSFEKKFIILIHDGLPAHKAKKVKEFLELNKDRIKSYQLPGYSPDLNPAEYVWSILKKQLGKQIQKSKKALMSNGLKILLSVKRDSQMIKSMILNIYSKLSISARDQ